MDLLWNGVYQFLILLVVIVARQLLLCITVLDICSYPYSYYFSSCAYAEFTVWQMLDQKKILTYNNISTFNLGSIFTLVNIFSTINPNLSDRKYLVFKTRRVQAKF